WSGNGWQNGNRMCHICKIASTCDPNDATCYLSPNSSQYLNVFDPAWAGTEETLSEFRTLLECTRPHLPPLHTWLHMWLRLRIFPINPKINACFGDEDLVQRICDVASGCHHRGTATNAVRRFLCVAAVHWITVCR
ncbi:unnamed protein product, partial [Effrenium voratum]